jgi:ligand-binding sensor domain-containing protein
MKKYLIPPVVLFLITGCEYTETDSLPFDPEIRFTVSSRIADGKDITCLYVTDEDNYYYSSGNQIIHIENLTENVTEVTSEVMSMDWNKTLNSLWFGTKSSGLGKLKEGKVTYYTKEKNNLPRDMVYALVCDPNGVVWFSSSAHMLGGLGRYMDGDFAFFTPENSSLPDNLIKSLACRDNTVYVSTGGTVTQQKVVSINGRNWKPLPVEGYYLMDMDVAPDGTLYVVDDTGLSSSMMYNKLYEYKNEKCKNILPQKSFFYPHPYHLRTDLRNNLWVAQFTEDGKGNLAVYDGDRWHVAPDDFPDLYIKCIEVDRKNNIWLGTSKGIYILNQ